MGNSIFEQQYTQLCKTVPAQDHAFYYLAKYVAAYCRDRQIVTWIRDPHFEHILKEYFGLDVAFGVSMRQEALQGEYVRDFATLRDKNDAYFVVSLHRSYDETAYKTLAEFGYKENEDFIFLKFKPIVIENFDPSNGYYYDEFGNSIESHGNTIGRIVISGFNNHIMLGGNITAAHNLHFNLTANTYIRIMNDIFFGGLTAIRCETFAARKSLTICRNCRFAEGANFALGSNSKVIINANCIFQHKIDFTTNWDKIISVGKDCVFSSGIGLCAGEAVAEFAVISGKRSDGFNDARFTPMKLIRIGEHVKVGTRALILAGSDIGSGCVVDADSVVSSIFPNNCEIAGNKAKVIKRDVAWQDSSKPWIPEAYDFNKYAMPTSEAKAPICGRKVLAVGVGATRYRGFPFTLKLIMNGNDVTIATKEDAIANFGVDVRRVDIDFACFESVRKTLNGERYEIVINDYAVSPLYVRNIIDNIACEKYLQISDINIYTGILGNISSDNMYDQKNQLIQIPDITVLREADNLPLDGNYNFTSTVIRIPYATVNGEINNICRSVINGQAIMVPNQSNYIISANADEISSFILFMAAQDYAGPINFASEGIITAYELLKYIEKLTGKTALIDNEKGIYYKCLNNMFSINLDNVKHLGWRPTNIHDWFWRDVDHYIAMAEKELTAQRK